MFDIVPTPARCRRLDLALQVIPGQYDPAVAVVSRPGEHSYVCENKTVPEFYCNGQSIAAVKKDGAYVATQPKCRQLARWVPAAVVAAAVTALGTGYLLYRASR